MQFIYLATFLTGLVLGVYVMIRGVERVVPSGHLPEFDALGRPTGRARMALTAPMAAAFATIFGATGYLLWRAGLSAAGAHVAIAIAAALTGTLLAGRAIARWATQAALHDVVDERYLLQGHPARVASPIASGQAGEVVYEVGGMQYATPAQSVDGSPVAAGTEVVIDRVENGVAFIEPWVQVEQRI